MKDGLIKPTTVVYPGIYGYRADKGFSPTNHEVDQPLFKVRRFSDGKEFFGYNGEVLVPRLGTYILMHDVVMPHVKQSSTSGRFIAVDVGTGSGIGALYISEATSHNPEGRVIATDICPHALDFAQINFQNNGVRRPADLRQTDLLTGIKEEFGKVDFIFSNPPFAPTAEVPRNGFDPIHAYDGGHDGLNFYRRIAMQAKDTLTPNGVLVFQISPCASMKSLIQIAKYSFPNSSVGLIGATEGPLKGYGPIGLIIGPNDVVSTYANRGIT